MTTSTNTNKRHGGAYDRGEADNYYGRPFDPHYYAGASYASERITVVPGTQEYDDYSRGWRDNSARNDRKDYE